MSSFLKSDFFSRLCFVLGEIPDLNLVSDAVFTLLNLCEDDNAQVRSYACLALGNLLFICSPDLKNEIICKLGESLVTDKENIVREWCCFGLIKAHSQTSMNYLARALKDRHKYVVGYVCEALRRIHTPEANQILINYLMNSRWTPFDYDQDIWK